MVELAFEALTSMRVNVDKPWCDVSAAKVDRPGRLTVDRPQSRYPSAADADIHANPGVSSAVKDPPVDEDQIERWRLGRWGGGEQGNNDRENQRSAHE